MGYISILFTFVYLPNSAYAVRGSLVRIRRLTRTENLRLRTSLVSVICMCRLCWHVSKTTSNLCTLPVDVARSSCDDSAIRHVLPVLWHWMASCFM